MTAHALVVHTAERQPDAHRRDPAATIATRRHKPRLHDECVTFVTTNTPRQQSVRNRRPEVILGGPASRRGLSSGGRRECRPSISALNERNTLAGSSDQSAA
jgi:hypothetical protein